MADLTCCYCSFKHIADNSHDVVLRIHCEMLHEIVVTPAEQAIVYCCDGSVIIFPVSGR